MSPSGQSYCWVADDGDIVEFSNGVWYTTILSTCPVPASGDTIQLSAVGTTITCSDITKGTSANVTDSSYWLAAGDLGILVDQRNSSVYALASFQADCVPTCGSSGATVVTPTFSPGPAIVRAKALTYQFIDRFLGGFPAAVVCLVVC
jgi:hypothetical protein